MVLVNRQAIYSFTVYVSSSFLIFALRKKSCLRFVEWHHVSASSSVERRIEQIRIRALNKTVVVDEKGKNYDATTELFFEFACHM